MRLLIVEDNAQLAAWLARFLRHENYVVDVIADGETVVDGADLDAFDLAIVDLGLPGIGGLEVVRHIRARHSTLPILILTAENGLKSRVTGLDSGADDYMTKPFEVEELEARIRALIRRSAAKVQSEIRAGPLALDQKSRMFSIDGAALALSPREHVTLEALLRRAGATVSKEVLIECSYGYDDSVNPSAIEVIVHRLRRKLEHSGVQVVTLRGLGYMLRVETP
ncbi:MAG: response regulator [Limimaricola sp.]|uniref:response regulator n=1 Tax=Limimaricola sp. TaxID=2211665 RepID=UPI001D55DA69|nr:response regulator [Limimaricola sp.]MBI1416202.1 response regulator [Limimaricola sp.]